MESICEGWLIKSPPEKRTQSRWKLFRAKWRRRYFVLYAPPAVDIIPGMCAAILDYYGGKNLRHKHGTIDLTHCEEVLSQLEASFYQNVFGLRTKDKGKDRTYYLVAETETVMNEWVNSLCFVLGMKENVQDSISSSISGPLPQPPRVSVPSPSISSLFSSVSSLPAPRSETLPFRHRNSGRRVLSHTRVQSLSGINETANTGVDEWHANGPTNRLRPPPPSAPPAVGTRDNHMTLRFVPPLPVVSTGQRHSCILSTVSDRPQVFPDPLLSDWAKDENSLQSSTEYDHPRQSYYHKIPSCDVNSNKFASNASGFYNVPSRSTGRAPEQDNLYKIPPSRRSKNYLYSDDVRYDVPASARQSYDVPAKCLEQHSANGEHYDVPPSGIPVPCLHSNGRSEIEENGESSADVIRSSHLLSVLQNLINELPSVDVSENHLVKPPMYCNWDVQPGGGTLEGKISPQELLLLSPPVPVSNNLPQHRYINDGTGNGEVPSVDNSSSVPVQNSKPMNMPRHPSYNQVPTANDPICFTHRSRSFKRTIECSDSSKPLTLPMKRISDVDESSSISDDDESCSVSNSDCSNEPTTPLKPSIYDIVPLPTQKDLGCSPAISKESEIIKYLDLDLESNLTTEKSSSPVKPCDALENKRGVQYKEIDWCKTKALTETRREVENKRRMGERTLGD